MWWVLYCQFDYTITYDENMTVTEETDCTVHGPFTTFSRAREEALIMACGDISELQRCTWELRKLRKKDIISK